MIDFDSKNLYISLSACETISSSISSENLQIMIDGGAKLNSSPVITYIKNGQKEISDYLGNVIKPEMDDYTQEYESRLINYVHQAENCVTTILQKDFVTQTELNEFDFADKTYVNTIANAKQDNLISGTNIKTINGSSLLGNGNLLVSALSDNSTISKNTSDELQAIAVIDNRGGSAIKTWTGTKAQYDAVSVKDNNTLYNVEELGLFKGAQAIASNASGRNIGEIVTSTIPLSDAGLHLLDGSLIQGSGSYSAFVTYIASLVSDYPDLFETEANWQQSVTTYGVCGKFVYDSVNNTVRLPKITGFVEGTTSLTALGDLIQAGLPNITGELYGMTKICWGQSNKTDIITQTGALRRHDVNGVYTGGSESATRGNGFTFDASLSNSIYGNSSTVQPQAIKVLYYIVLATSAKTQIEVDIDEIAADLNTKADVDLSNVSIASSFSNALNTAGIRTVVESYQNGTDWYRIWSDGWVEQGGFTPASASTSGYITLLVEMRDTNYFCRAYYQANDTGGARTNYGYCGAYSTTQILVGSYSTNFKNSWEVKGFKK